MRELAPGVWQLAGFLPNAINVYLIQAADGDVLIDAGTRWHQPRIQHQLRGRTLSLVALTHCHPDHQGMAKAVCDAFQVPLACHAADAPVAEGKEPMRPNTRLIRITTALFGGPPHPVGRFLADGDDIAGFRVVHTPGHTPGHVVFFRDSDRVAISGDVVNTMNIVTVLPGLHEPPWFFSVDPALNRKSMRVLADLRPAVICPGHGPALRDPDRLARHVDRFNRT